MIRSKSIDFNNIKGSLNLINKYLARCQMKNHIFSMQEINCYQNHREIVKSLILGESLFFIHQLSEIALKYKFSNDAMFLLLA